MDTTTGKRTAESHQEIVATIVEAITARGLSQAEVARQSDVSPSALSAFLAGRYRGDNDEVGRKLRTWHDGLAVMDALQGVAGRFGNWAETPTARRIMASLDFAKAQGEITAVAGTSGVGKTMTLQHFASTRPNVWRCSLKVYSTGSRRKPSAYAALAKIARTIGLTILPTRPDQLGDEVERRMRGTRGLLILDEAHELQSDGFEAVRGIYDTLAEEGCPIGVVFAGHLDLMDKIRRLPQLNGRMLAPLVIGAATPADVDALLDAWGVDCSRSRAFLRQFAGQNTGLRRIAKAMKLAATYAAAEAGEVTYAHVRKAWEGQGGSVTAA